MREHARQRQDPRGEIDAADGARVVSLTSRANLASPVVFEDISFQRRGYDPWLAYGQSKTANVLFAVGANAPGSAPMPS